MPVFNAFLFNSIATISSAAFGVVPTTRTMAILDFEITPVKTLMMANPVTFFREGNYVSPFVNDGQNAVYKLPGTTGDELDNYGEQLSTFLFDKNDTIHVDKLKPVQWRANYPEGANRNIYTVDGKPPY